MTVEGTITHGKSFARTPRTLTVCLDASGCLAEDITVKSGDNIITIQVGRREFQDRRGYFLRKIRRGYLLPSYADIPRAHYNLTVEGILKVRVPVKKGVASSEDAKDRNPRLVAKDDTVIARLPIASEARNIGFKEKTGPPGKEGHVLIAVPDVFDISMPRYAVKDFEPSTSVSNTATGFKTSGVQKVVDKRPKVASDILIVSKSLPDYQDHGRFSIIKKIVSASKSLPTEHDNYSSRATAHTTATFESLSAEQSDQQLDAQQGVSSPFNPGRFHHTGRRLNVAVRSQEARSLPIQQDGRHSMATAAIAGNLPSCSDEDDGERLDFHKDVLTTPNCRSLQHQDRQFNIADHFKEPRLLGNVDLSRQLEAAGDGQHVGPTQGLVEGNLALL